MEKKEEGNEGYEHEEEVKEEQERRRRMGAKGKGEERGGRKNARLVLASMLLPQ